MSSSQQQLVEDLKISRETAKNALKEINKKISKIKENVKSKSSVSYNTVHAICLAIKAGGGFHEIYADAIEELAGNISEHHWNMFVELLRYILGEFYTKNLFKRTGALAALAKAERINTSSDVKSHLKLYSRHLYYSHTYMSDGEIKENFKNMMVLLVKCKEIQFEDLLVDFQAHFLGFPSMLQSMVVKHLDKAVPMFEKYFAALEALKIQTDAFLLLTKSLIHFLQLDVTDKNTVLSQNFLRAWKENQSMKEQKYQSYAVNLFYYLVKLLLFPNTLDFNKNFLEILAKVSSFMERSELATEVWFMDTIVTFARIFDTFKAQNVFLQSMNEESYHASFVFIEKLVKLAHGISYESGLWTCCTSVRKHVIFKLCLVELVMFESAVEQGYLKQEIGISAYTILKHSIAVAEFFKCSTVNYEVASIVNSLVRCAQNIKTKEHGEQLAKMLLATTKAGAHLPENSGRTLVKCLMHAHKTSGDTHGQAEACALYISHLMENKGDTDLIRRYIGVFYSLETCTSLLETLDRSTFPLKPKKFSRRILYSMEAGVFCKLRDNNILTTTSLLKSAETVLDFVLIARQCPQVNVTVKLERKYSELKSKSNPTPVEQLALGHICKMQAVQQMDDLKNLFNLPKLNDESLSKVSDPGKLKMMDVISEMQIMKLAVEGVELFNKFFEVASHQQLSEEEDYFVEWEPIMDDLAMLARLFHFRGYVDYSYLSWRLLLQVSTYLNDILNQIRALSFICDQSQFVELYDPKLDFENEIKSRENGIYECLINMEFLTPRKQNYVLICLCNIAWYFAQKHRFEESQLLLDLALGKVEELAERKSKFELVRATHLAVSFRINWKLQKGLSKRKVFTQVDKILDEIRAVAYYTSEDSLNFPILLFGVVSDISEFTTNRLCEPATIPYVQMVLKLALDAGAAYRVVQFLGLWTHINLQSENVAKCQVKLDLIDILFRNVQSTKSRLKVSQNAKLKNEFESGPIEPYRIYGEEPVRKALYVNPVSPVRIKYKAPTVHRDLESFLITHDSYCTCDKCSHTFLIWQFFKVGCLNARLLYLGDVYTDPELFYTKALQWCAKTLHKSHTKFQFKEYELSMLIQYVNLLRRKGNLKAALTISEASIELYDKFKDALDGAYHVNFLIQSESTTAELQKNRLKSKTPTRRILKFSPSDHQPTSAQPPTIKRKGRARKDSPKTLRENIENIIYKDSANTPAAQKLRTKDGTKSSKRKEKNTIDEICKTVEQIQLDDVVPKKTTATRRGGRQNLNTAIIIIDDDDDDDSTPPEPTATCKMPKSASKIECTPKTRGRPKKLPPPATIAVVKSGEVETRSKLLLRRRI